MAQQAKCFPQNLNSLTLTPPSLAGQPTPQRRPPPRLHCSHGCTFVFLKKFAA